jgi:hypothetical protein
VLFLDDASLPRRGARPGAQGQLPERADPLLRQLQLAVVLKTDDWAALDALVGTTATLDTATGLVATTALVDTGQPQFHGDGFVRTTLTFEFA